jgi:hypothetical protein
MKTLFFLGVTVVLMLTSATSLMRTAIEGHWIQPVTAANGTPYASPVTLIKDKQNIWRGEVSPLDDAITFYLMIKARDDGSVGAFLKNPERNIGRFIRLDHLERDGESIKLFAADSAGERGRVLAEGKYYADSEIISIYFPTRDETYEFKRVAANESSDFYPRGRPTASYTYAPPLSLDDGWQTASLEDVGISREGIRKFIRMITAVITTTPLSLSLNRFMSPNTSCPQ